MAKTGRNTYTQTYTDDLGNPVVLGKELARGGEGRVCLVQGNSNVVAKLYLDKALNKHDKAGKIKAMCDLYDNNIAKFSALPQRVIYNSRNKVVGFIMEKISDFKEIHNLYGISTKRKIFDFADWGFMVHSAKNLAIAVDKLHSKNIIIGDINQGNILVNNQAMIKLIDCDSYQVEYNGKFYLCEVGVPEYTSPELQGQSFNGIHRTKNHDCFGLAVMIFKILMFGRHPYSGVGAPPEIENSIKQGCYCYGNYSKGTTPIYSQLFSDALSEEVKELFERAFSKNTVRPTAEEWINTLECLEQNLIQCSNNHKYYNNGKSCIWCKLSKYGFNPFGSSAINTKPQNKPNYQQTPYTYNPPKQKSISNVSPNYNTSYQSSQPQQAQPVSNKINFKPIFIILAVSFFVGIIGAFIDSNNNSTYTPPVANQTTNNITTQANIPEQKTYTEAEKNADLKEYKDKFVSRVKQHWNPGRESFLIDNSSLSVQIDKQGNIKFQNDTTSDDAASTIMRQAVSNGQPYSALPKSYEADTLSLTLYFEGNTDSYWGNSQPKSTYQVSLAPFKKNQTVKSPVQDKITTTKRTSAPVRTYSSPEEYLSTVASILRGRYSSNYSVDCTVLFNPVNNSMQVLNDSWNGDVARNFLYGVQFEIPAYVDDAGNKVPIIITFAGHSISGVKFQYPPVIKAANIQKQNTSSANVYKQSSISNTSSNKINQQAKNQLPTKPKTDLQKSTDDFFE